MKTIKIIAGLILIIFLLGCGGGVVSKNIVGFEPYPLSPKELDGTWLNPEGAIVVKVIDPKNGIARVSFVQEADDFGKIENIKLQIMKGNSWLYVNMSLNDHPSNTLYKWGRVIKKKNTIVLWNPSMGDFIKAIRQNKIKGSIIEKEGKEKGVKVITEVRITDKAKNLIELIESNDGKYFIWDDPTFFIRWLY